MPETWQSGGPDPPGRLGSARLGQGPALALAGALCQGPGGHEALREPRPAGSWWPRWVHPLRPSILALGRLGCDGNYWEVSQGLVPDCHWGGGWQGCRTTARGNKHRELALARTPPMTLSKCLLQQWYCFPGYLWSAMVREYYVGNSRSNNTRVLNVHCSELRE